MKNHLLTVRCLVAFGLVVALSAWDSQRARAQDPLETARILYEQGADPTTCAAKLERHFDLTAEEAAQILTDVYPIDIQPCADALEAVYRTGIREAGQVCSRCPDPTLVHSTESLEPFPYHRPRWMGALNDAGLCDQESGGCLLGNLGASCESDEDCDLRISHLSIPGTHESCSRFGGALYECQHLTVTQQLESGTRALDLRVKPICDSSEPEGALHLYHGGEDQRIGLPAVLDQIARFLALHSTETVLVRVKPLVHSWLCAFPFPGFAPMFEAALAEAAHVGTCSGGAAGVCEVGDVGAPCSTDADCDLPVSDFLWSPDPDSRETYCASTALGIAPGTYGGPCDAQDSCPSGYECVEKAPKLADVRGRVVLMKEFAGAEDYGFEYVDQPSGRPEDDRWYAGSPRMSIQDKYKVYFTTTSMGNKRDRIRKHLDYAGDYACRPPEVCEPEDWWDRDRNTLFVNYTSAGEGMYPIDTARGVSLGIGMNETAYDHLKWLGGIHDRGRAGVVMMDYPGAALIDAVLSHNPPGLPAGDPDALPVTCWNVEKWRVCGFGPELLPILAVLWWLQRRAQRREAGAAA